MTAAQIWHGPEALRPALMPLDLLNLDPHNARAHSDRNIEAIGASLTAFGQMRPLVVQAETRTVVAGNGTLRAMRALGWTHAAATVAEISPATARAYAIADNRTAELAEWDVGELSDALNDPMLDGLLDAVGFSADEIDDLLRETAGDAGELSSASNDDGNETASAAALEIVEDEAPEPPADPVTKTGDLWLLGEHRLLCGDSTKADDVARIMGGATAVLLHADPPYGMGKESEGVQNDNLYRDKLDRFQMDWWRTFRPYLADNASAYIWGNAPDLWRLWYVGGLADSERLTVRNEITWDKGSFGWGQATEQGRCFARYNERCLFFMLGEQGFNNNADNYWEGWEPIRSYLAEETSRIGWTAKDLNRITGTGMASHWITKSQWGLITEEQYRKIQQAAKEHDAFKREHDELKREHDELKREHDELKRAFYATRAYFDNTHDNMTDVWGFPRVTGEDRHGHATPKPVAMIARALLSSSPPDSLVIEPFLGSGTTLIAAEQTGRKCYGMELSPAYCDVIVQRWEKQTGKTAKRPTR